MDGDEGQARVMVVLTLLDGMFVGRSVWVLRFGVVCYLLWRVDQLACSSVRAC